MSAAKTEIDLKEGHALPATKLAGGVRVRPSKTHKHPKGEKSRSNSESSDVEEVISVSPKQQHPIISGAQTKGDQDFKPEAIKAYQEKPMKISNKLMNGSGRDSVIHQPKKF